MFFKKHLLSFVLVCVLCSFVFFTLSIISRHGSDFIAADECESLVDKIDGIHKSIDDDVFDPNVYFGVLNYLSMESGYALDWVYDGRCMPLRPILYSRKDGEMKISNASDYFSKYGKPDFFKPEIHSHYYTNYVHIKDSPMGYFQYIVLWFYGDRFHVIHMPDTRLSSLYNFRDCILVCSKKRGNDLCQELYKAGFLFEKTYIEKAKNVNFSPLIIMHDNAVSIYVTTADLNYMLLRHCFIISRTFPHRVLTHVWWPCINGPPPMKTYKIEGVSPQPRKTLKALQKSDI